MFQVLLVAHIIVAAILVILVLLQRSEGGALGIGGGGPGGLMSGRAAGNVLTKSTGILATAFFATSILLTVFSQNLGDKAVDFDTDVPAPAAIEPVTPAPAEPQEDAAPAIPQETSPATEPSSSDEEKPAEEEKKDQPPALPNDG